MKGCFWMRGREGERGRGKKNYAERAGGQKSIASVLQAKWTF